MTTAVNVPVPEVRDAGPNEDGWTTWDPPLDPSWSPLETLAWQAGRWLRDTDIRPELKAYDDGLVKVILHHRDGGHTEVPSLTTEKAHYLLIGVSTGWEANR